MTTMLTKHMLEKLQMVLCNTEIKIQKTNINALREMRKKSMVKMKLRKKIILLKKRTVGTRQWRREEKVNIVAKISHDIRATVRISLII